MTAGFTIVGFYEDHWPDGTSPLNRFSPVAIATRAVKRSVEQPLQRTATHKVQTNEGRDAAEPGPLGAVLGGHLKAVDARGRRMREKAAGGSEAPAGFGSPDCRPSGVSSPGPGTRYGGRLSLNVAHEAPPVCGSLGVHFCPLLGGPALSSGKPCAGDANLAADLLNLRRLGFDCDDPRVPFDRSEFLGIG